MKTLFFSLFLIMPVAVQSRECATVAAGAVESGYVEVDGGRLYYDLAGQGPWVVLLHDGMVHREIWDNQFQWLSENFRVVRYDRRGYGKSTDPAAPFSDIDDLNRLFEALKIDRATVFGMSSGGGLAIDFTLTYPAKVNGLVLVGAVVSGYGYSSHMRSRGGRIRYPEDFADAWKIVRYFALEDPYEIWPENKDARQKVLQWMESGWTPERDKARSKFYKGPGRSAVKALEEIKVLTLVMAGEFDIPDVHAHAGVINAGIPNSTRVIIPKSGHLVPLEQPALFNAEVGKFLKDVQALKDILK